MQMFVVTLRVLGKRVEWKKWFMNEKRWFGFSFLN